MKRGQPENAHSGDDEKLKKCRDGYAGNPDDDLRAACLAVARGDSASARDLCLRAASAATFSSSSKLPTSGGLRRDKNILANAIVISLDTKTGVAPSLAALSVDEGVVLDVTTLRSPIVGSLACGIAAGLVNHSWLTEPYLEVMWRARSPLLPCLYLAAPCCNTSG